MHLTHHCSDPFLLRLFLAPLQAVDEHAAKA